MRVLILTLLSLIFFSSCKLIEKNHQRICNGCPVKDSIVYIDQVKLHDTTIYITEQGPIQYLENPCKKLCDSLGNLKPFEIKKKENGIVGTIKSVGNSIEFDCKDDSLQAVIRGLIDRNRITKEKVNSVKEIPCDKEHRTSFDGFTRWWFYITGALLILYITWRVLKAYLHL